MGRSKEHIYIESHYCRGQLQLSNGEEENIKKREKKIILTLQKGKLVITVMAEIKI